MKRAVRAFALLFMMLMLTSCDVQTEELTLSDDYNTAETESEPEQTEEPPAQEEITPEIIASADPVIDLGEIPVYSGEAYVEINGNVPYFTDSELSTTSYEYYSDLDSLGRCGVCVANIGTDIMPTEERGEIGNIKPTGWHTVKYSEIIEGNYLYNRCHLIGFQLAGENDNEKNLITGTRYLNMSGMLPFENMVADYVKETGNHVLYRVTPIFEGENLVADGVLIEAESVEDNGSGILFNVFCYNIQPGIVIDYATGDSAEDGTIVAKEESIPEPEPAPAQATEVTPETTSEATETVPETEETTPAATEAVPETAEIAPAAEATAPAIETAPATAPEPQAPADAYTGSGSYAVNSNNGKIHIVGACSATGSGKNAMKRPVYFGTYEEAESYSVQIAPSQDKRKCGNCW